MNIKNKQLLFLPITLLIIALFYFHTIFYAIKSYDEIVPFKETYLPTCFSFAEMFELISALGLKQHFEATNTLYSSIVSLRCNPLGNFLQLFIQVLFKKNPIAYHSYSLILHLISSSIIFFILNKIARFFLGEKKPLVRSCICMLLTLLWALHPLNIESVLLLSNANIVLSYTLCFISLFFYFFFLDKDLEIFKLTFLKFALIFIPYLIALLSAEFHFLLPAIVTLYIFAINIHKAKEINFKSIQNNLWLSIKSAMPFHLASFIFISLFLSSNTRVNIGEHTSLKLILERVFWLSPQVIFHFSKLILFPVKLSVDQTIMVQFGKSLLDPYSVFCLLFVLGILLISIISLLKSNKTFPFSFIILFLYLITLIPFSQALAPLYNFASERYLYFPLFILVLGVSHFCFYILDKHKENKKIIVLILSTLFLVTSAYSSRALIRTLDWKDSFTLYYSAIKISNNPLHKAFRYKALTTQDKVFTKYPHREVSIEYQALAIENLELAIKELKEQREKYQSNLPEIIKRYGLDPSTLLAKAGYLLANSSFTINNDHKKALEIFKPYTKDLSRLDSAALSFYGSLLYYNGQFKESEDILRKAYELTPYATRIIFPLCEIIQITRGDLNEMESLSLKAFKYFPYDTFTLLILNKIYSLKKDYPKLAFFSYVYGLRHHSIQDLYNARDIYSSLNNPDMVNKINKEIVFLKTKLNY